MAGLVPDSLEISLQDERSIALKSYIIDDVRTFVIILTLAALVGWGSGAFFVCISLGLLLFIGLQFRSLYLANQWINQASHNDPPALSGVWGALVFNVYRVQRRERLLQAEMLSLIDRAQTALMEIDEAFVLIDDQHCLEWCNPAAERLLGLKFGDQGRPVLSLLRQPEFVDYFNQFDQFPDGIVLSYVEDERFTQIKLRRFGLGSSLLLAYDVTRIRKLEQIRKDFVDNVSHELRTPLTVLSGYLETLSEHDDMPPRWHRAFSQMRQQTRRMNMLVNDLLLLSRLENEPASNKRQIIHMAELMNQLFDDAQGYNTDYGHTLNLNIESHRDLIGSDTELASAFSNLITNAIKYTPPHGVITISWHDRGDESIFAVQDNGIGISATHLPRLTERFYRVDSGRSRETGGTGLGLAIVKHVLAQHDAHLEIHSQELKGSTFKAVFPKERLDM